MLAKYMYWLSLIRVTVLSGHYPNATRLLRIVISGCDCLVKKLRCKRLDVNSETPVKEISPQPNTQYQVLLILLLLFPKAFVKPLKSGMWSAF